MTRAELLRVRKSTGYGLLCNSSGVFLKLFFFFSLAHGILHLLLLLQPLGNSSIIEYTGLTHQFYTKR